ncbi:MAG: putative L-galactonate transporter [Paracidovorax wautersii]|uniref:Putative L-galactonate transporter n=1 Tax=Paracidovorax wautersii TaxID=1177982 RepID=A0A7V8FRP6_9BURK|nr:MAG: putative L-galactonate transporter [Paracidovorax wautersii]
MTTTPSPIPSTVTPRTARVRWTLVAILLLIAIVNYLDRANLAIASGLISTEFGLSSTQMGLLLSAFLWPYALANLPAGWLIDRFGPKRILTGAMSVWGVVTAGAAAVNAFAPLYGLRMLLGVTEAPFFPASIKVMHRWFAQRERGLPTSVINTGSQIANAIAPPLLTVLMLTLGWRGMFIAIGLASIPLLAIWLLCFRMPSASEAREIHGAEAPPPTPQPAAAPAQPDAGWSALFRQRVTWFMILGNFSIMFTIWVYLTWLPRYLQSTLGFNLSQTGWIASLPFMAGILGVLVGGQLSDWLIRRGHRTLFARKVPIVGGALLAACSVAPIPFLGEAGTIVALLTLGYFASQMPSGVIWTLASDVAPPAQVASLGAIQNFGGFLGAACAPIATGVILDATGSFKGVFLLGATLLLLGALSYGLFVRKAIATNAAPTGPRPLAA